jgi:hypothetical protein
MIDPFEDKSPEQMLETARSDERGLSCSLQIGSQRHLVMATSSMNEGEGGTVWNIILPGLELGIHLGRYHKYRVGEVTQYTACR